VTRCSGDLSPQTVAAPDLAALFRQPTAAHDGRASAMGQSAGNGLAESAQYKGGQSLPVSQPPAPHQNDLPELRRTSSPPTRSPAPLHGIEAGPRDEAGVPSRAGLSVA
jgi:hypothetical protein